MTDTPGKIANRSSSECKKSAAPLLTFGVVSDLHVRRVADGCDEPGCDCGCGAFRRALEWFRDQGVDAVVVPGDLSDIGLDEGLMAVAETWFSVFPDDRLPDGRHVERIIVTGNHDWEGYRYGGHAAAVYPDEAELRRHSIRFDIRGWWRKAFREEYSPFFEKTVKGYRFVCANWDTGTPDDPASDAGRPFAHIAGWLAANGPALDPSKPFFYIQHPHPKGTCHGPNAWGHDDGASTVALSAWPNAVAISGHSHLPLTDGRAVWQGAFTSVGAGGMQRTGLPFRDHPPAGFENSAEDKENWRLGATKTMDVFDRHDCRQGSLWRVFDDRIVVRRREFVSGLDLGPDWTIPFPAKAQRGASVFGDQEAMASPPSFPPGASLRVDRVLATTRGGKSPDGKETVPPEAKACFKIIAPSAVKDEDARLWELEFTAETEDGAKKTKLVVPEGFNHALAHPKVSAPSFCLFARSELGKGRIRFTATPVNCFGERGVPLSIFVNP